MLYIKMKRLFKRQVISKETSDLMRIALEHVVAIGTGRNSFIDGYRVGGKTGTAQKPRTVSIWLETTFYLLLVVHR